MDPRFSAGLVVPEVELGLREAGRLLAVVRVEVFWAEVFLAGVFAAEVFLAGVFAAEVFFAEAFLVEVFLVEVFLVEAFLVEVVLVEVFLVEVVLVEVFFAEAFFAADARAEAFLVPVFVGACRAAVEAFVLAVRALDARVEVLVGRGWRGDGIVFTLVEMGPGEGIGARRRAGGGESVARGRRVDNG